MKKESTVDWFQEGEEARLEDFLSRKPKTDINRIREILAKAREAKGMSIDEITALLNLQDPDCIEELFAAARQVKETIYGRRLVLFAPLYVSNLCRNECLYCAFRARNKAVARRALSQDEIRGETLSLIHQGHKRILVVAGESHPDQQGFSYILDTIATIYTTKNGSGEIRRVNANLAPLAVEEFRQLKEAQIGTYQLFQETYHRKTYHTVHVAGKKRDYDWRTSAFDRALKAGINDIGMGVLFGLYDWRFEVLALLRHIRHLEECFGVGPHTISVPRIEPAVGSDFTNHPPYTVSDTDFLKLVAILRLAVPYTGMIMSTRETPDMRRKTFALGISQISAGSRTNPGGYSEEEKYDASQFSLGDHRSLDDVIRDITELGYIPSFCTACYRLGRTGQDFMDLAKPGLIKSHCAPNAVSTFLEYLLDYGSKETKSQGEAVLPEILEKMDLPERTIAIELLTQVRKNQRDVFV